MVDEQSAEPVFDDPQFRQKRKHGRYRVVDFMLSNMVNAGITDVGLIVHANYQSLLDHVGSGKDWT